MFQIVGEGEPFMTQSIAQSLGEYERPLVRFYHGLYYIEQHYINCIIT